MTKANAQCAALLTIVLDALERFDRTQLSESQAKLFDMCETGLTLLEGDFDGHGRDPELADSARASFGIQ